MHSTASPVSSIGLSQAASVRNSQHWFSRAKRVLAGGVSSSARATTAGGRPHPLYITHGQGSHIWDADDNEFIDYLLSFGSCILGHAHPEIVQAVQQQVERGTMFGTCNTAEVELAEQIAAMMPSAELVRYANSGSEAIQGAIRAARGFTGKTKILKFEGHYHGWVDLMAVSTRPAANDTGPIEAPHSVPHCRGIAPSAVEDVIICPWNEPAILKRLLDQHDRQIAAIIAEPIVANNACLMPQSGYLELLREECDRRGIVLIFDEIVTGLRIRPGGAQELFGVPADITVLSKALGGGLPISAFAGRRKIMDLIASNTVKHGGTYNGNPLCAVAALQTLRLLSDPAVQEQMDAMGQQLMEAIRSSAADLHIPCVVQGTGAMFQVVFGPDGKPPRHYRDLLNVDSKRYAAFQTALLEQGVHITPSHTACWFMSTSHTSEEIASTVDVIRVAMKQIA